MGTATYIPEMPSGVAQVDHYQGVAAEERKHKRRKALNQAKMQGLIKEATILNKSPFVLSLATGGLIQFQVPACPEGKEFSFYTVKPEETITFPRFTGNKEMRDKSVRASHDVSLLLPIEQVMQFRDSYFADGGFEGLKQGGIVIFEGAAKNLKKETIVRVPRWTYLDNERFITFDERVLGELLVDAEDQMRQKCLNVINQCNGWSDKGGQNLVNIQAREHQWADLAVRKGWISESPKWRHVHVRVEDQCPRCHDHYRSKTGVCKCNFVVDPFTAFMMSEISVDHVRMDTLTKEQWVKVKAEVERRKLARG
jgi:hypothetical protein